MNENKCDLSIPLARANVFVIVLAIPLIALQIALFTSLYGSQGTEANIIPLLVIIVLGIFVHELIHGVTWMIIGGKDFSAVKFGFQWKTLTPYAHLKEPMEVNVYRISEFMPGLLLGILPYLLSLILANGNLFWFSLFHLSGALGDFIILWILRNVKAGSLVEDHPKNIGCYILETNME